MDREIQAHEGLAVATARAAEDTQPSSPPRRSDTECRDRVAGYSIYYPWFDWLRFALACVVLLSHDGLIPAWPAAGDFAVQVFFALSGWLIGGLLLRMPARDLPRFYFNRTLRIWCPYFIALALLLSASALRDPITSRWTEFAFYKTTFTYNLFGVPQLATHKVDMPLAGTGNHFWSVNAEEQFYLLAPLLLVLCPIRYGRSLIVWSSIALLAWTTGTYASIVFGVLASLIAYDYGGFHRRRNTRIVCGTVVVCAAVALGAGASYRLVAPWAALAIVLLLAVEGKQNRVAAFAGGLSYPLYLNAWIGVFVVNAMFKRVGIESAVAGSLLKITGAIVLAGILYAQVDRRVLAVRRRLYTRKRALLSTVLAYGIVGVGLVAAVVLSWRA